jgi:RNA polymerase sigma-70 factor, ECF subfamily
VVEGTSVTAGPLGEVERVYRARGPVLWRAILLFSGDREIANDAVAEAFAQALRRGEEVRSLERWIWRTAFLVARGMLKERRNIGWGSGLDVPDQHSQLPERTVELFQLLRQLSPRQRAVVVLHYYADYPLREIAALLDSTTAAVGVHLTRARRRLRVLLEEAGDV